METTLQLASWGGSIALRIPRSILRQMNLTEKSSVKVKLDGNNELIVSPVYRHKTLEERFSGWEGESYELTSEDREWLNMPAAGREIEC